MARNASKYRCEAQAALADLRKAELLVARKCHGTIRGLLVDHENPVGTAVTLVLRAIDQREAV